MNSKQLMTALLGGIGVLLVVLVGLIVMAGRKPVRHYGEEREAAADNPSQSPAGPNGVDASWGSGRAGPNSAEKSGGATGNGPVAAAAGMTSPLRGGAARPADPDEASIAENITVEGGVSALAFSPDGAMLASGTADGTVRILKVADGTELRRFEGAKGMVVDIAFSADGKLLASVENNKHVHVWDVASGSMTGTFETDGEVRGVRFLKGDNVAAAVGENIVIYKQGEGAAVKTIATGSTIHRMDASADGTKIVVGQSEVGMIRLFDVQSGKRLGEYRHHTSSRDAELYPENSRAEFMQIGAVHFMDDRRVLVGGNEVGTYLWDWQSGGIEDFGLSIAGLRYWGISGALVIAGEGGGVVHGYDTTEVSKGGPPADVSYREKMLVAGRGGYSCMATSRDFIALGRGVEWQKDGSWKPNKFSGISLIRIARLEEPLVAQRDRHDAAQAAAKAKADAKAASPWGQLNATFEKAREKASVPLVVIEGQEQGIAAMQFSPDGQLLATGGTDCAVHLYDTDTWKEASKLVAHRNPITDLCFSVDGKKLLSADWYGTIIEWDVKGRSIDGKIESNRNILHCALLPDGKRAVTTGLAVDFWDMATERQIAEGDIEQEANGLAVSAAGDVVTADSAGEIVLWDPATGGRVRDLKLKGGVGGVRFIDADTVATASETTWNIRTGEQKRSGNFFSLGTIDGGKIGISDAAFVLDATDMRDLLTAKPDGGRKILSDDRLGTRLYPGAVDPKGRWVGYAVAAGPQAGGNYVSSGPGLIFVYDVKKIEAAEEAAKVLGDYSHAHHLNNNGDPK